MSFSSKSRNIAGLICFNTTFHSLPFYVELLYKKEKSLVSYSITKTSPSEGILTLLNIVSACFLKSDKSL